MRKLILLAGAAVMAVSMTASAEAKGKPAGAGHGNQGAVHGNQGGMHADHGANHATTYHRAANGCPPGLMRKNNGCLPPGQAKKLFAQGARVPTGYRYYSAYSAIPAQYRTQVPYQDNYNYIYRDNSVYVVDRRTSLVTRIINLLR